MNLQTVELFFLHVRELAKLTYLLDDYRYNVDRALSDIRARVAVLLVEQSDPKSLDEAHEYWAKDETLGRAALYYLVRKATAPQLVKVMALDAMEAMQDLGDHLAKTHQHKVELWVQALADQEARAMEEAICPTCQLPVGMAQAVQIPIDPSGSLERRYYHGSCRGTAEWAHNLGHAQSSSPWPQFPYRAGSGRFTW